MNLYRDWNELPSAFGPTALTMGNFDGVHLGHQLVLERVLETARKQGITACVLTFHPHPVKVLHPERAPAMLQTLEDRISELARFGVDALLVAPFTSTFADFPAEVFVRDLLINRLGCADLFVGQDATFGQGRAGNIDMLTRMAEEGSFRLHVTDPVMMDGERVSSSRIRKLVVAGDVALAARLMGRPFTVSGIVVRGAGRGRTLGFPTANLAPDGETLPANGIYACRAETEDAVVLASVHVGPVPTFGSTQLVVEAHLLDFDKNLLGKRLRIHFLQRIREVRAFLGPDDLVGQIRKDIAATRELDLSISSRT